MTGRSPVYYPIYAMATRPPPPTIKLVDTIAAGLELSYPAGALEYSVYSAKGVVNTSLYTTVQKGKNTWDNVTSVSITLTDDALTQDGLCHTDTPMRVKLSPTYIENEQMKGKVTYGSSMTFLKQNKVAFKKAYTKLISRMLPGDIVKITPQETRTGKTGHPYQLWQVDRLKRVCTLHNTKQNKGWFALPLNGALTVTAQARSSARIPAMYHGQYEGADINSVHIWSTAGSSCLLNNKANYIPNAGSKLVVVNSGLEGSIEPVLVPIRPFTSVGAPSLASSECGDEDISRDTEIQILADEFDFDGEPQLVYNSPINVNESLKSLTLVDEPSKTETKSPVKAGNEAPRSDAPAIPAKKQKQQNTSRKNKDAKSKQAKEDQMEQ